MILHNPNVRKSTTVRKKELTLGLSMFILWKKLARMLRHIMIIEQNWKCEDAELTERRLSNLDRAEERSVASA
jgi:hypothetical protein